MTKTQESGKFIAFNNIPYAEPLTDEFVSLQQSSLKQSAKKSTMAP